MLALYIVGGIAILLIVLLEMPLILAVSVKNTTVHIQGIVGFFRVFDSKKFLANMIDKPKKKRKNKHKKRKKVQNNKVKSGKKQSLFSKVGGFGFEDIKLLWARLCKNTRRLCRKTKIYDFRLESRVVCDDAAATAICYGAECAVLYNAMRWTEERFNFRVRDYDEQVKIHPDFAAETNRFSLNFRVRTRPIHLVILAVDIVCGYLSGK